MVIIVNINPNNLIVSLKIDMAYPMDVTTVFHLILYLFNEDNLIESYEETIYDLRKIKDEIKYITYLLYERVTNLSFYQRSKSRSVRLDSLLIKETSVQYICSWLFQIPFPFLPVNKLVAEISLRNELFRIVNCKKRCGSHGKCMYYINMRHVEYCWCEQGWSGDRCVDIRCENNGICLPLDERKSEFSCACQENYIDIYCENLQRYS